jgi:hypothetical protein
VSYVNSYTVTYSKKDEFYLELRQDRPEEHLAVGSFFMRPEDAKGLMLALKTMVDDYEKEHGAIEATKIERTDTEPPKSDWKGIA